MGHIKRNKEGRGRGGVIGRQEGGGRGRGEGKGGEACRFYNLDNIH